MSNTKKRAKSTQKNKKTKKNIKFTESMLALTMVIIGIITIVVISMKSIGLVGVFFKSVILMMFSSFSYIIAFMFIAFGIYKLANNKEFSFKKINIFDLIIFILLLNFLYIIFNISYMKEHSEFSLSAITNIASRSKDFKDIGLIPYFVSFLFFKLIGKIGIILFEIIGASYLIIKYKKKEVIQAYQKTKEKYNQFTEDKKQNKNQESEINFTGEFFSDRPTFDDIEIKDKKEIIKFDTPLEDAENTNKSIENNLDEITVNFADDNRKENVEIQTHDTQEIIKDDTINNKSENEQIKTICSNDDLNCEEKKPYIAPTFELLNEYEVIKVSDRNEKIEKAKILQKTLQSFSVEAVVENISVGPTITRYELKPKIGTKVSKITNLTEDLALALAAKSIRIEAPIPGKPYIGVEVPNEIMQTVSFKEIIKTCMEKKDKYNIVFAMGKDISGEVILSDITKMPHALIAGSTGSGKSVCINTMICSIIYNYSPEEVKLILVDPKVVELSVYNKLPHLVIPVVTDMKKAPHALNWAVNEMEKRYKAFADNKAKDITSYNQKADEKMPRIVIIIDELADLMMVAAKEIEEAICRLAQKARACGIHLIVATQRPSVDVITGLIKANIPSRIAFAVSSQTDSRTILDMSGAEKLLGKGDMLYCPIGMSKPIRIQGAFLSEEEVERITNFIEQNNKIENLKDIQEEVTKQIEQICNTVTDKENLVDEIYNDVVEFAYKNEEISVSLVQRQFRVGYNRASRIVDEMEKNGIVGKSDGSKPRKVIKNNLN